MDSLDNFLDFHIDRLTADQAVPVDPFAVARKLGAEVEEREMIPEAAMNVDGDRFHIYLQSNFKNIPGAALRSRFSLAHEIGHTLFYENQDGHLKARAGAPRGERLEAACQKAAGMILVPATLLRRELNERTVGDGAAVVELSARFDVSIEVMLRRLNEVGELTTDWIPVLVRRNGVGFEIEHAPYPPWLKSHLLPPKRGADFSGWFQPTETAGNDLRRQLRDGRLEAKFLPISASKAIYELRFILT